MTSSTAGHRHITKSKELIIFVFGMLMVAAVGLVAAIQPEDSANQSLIAELSGPRIGGGRFSRAQAGPFDPTRHGKALAKAELSVLSTPDSAVTQRIQSLIDSSDGRLHEAARVLETLNESQPGNAELLNDLGVVYLALGSEKASNYFKALTLFEQAEKISPHAPAPRFNRVVAYRQTGLRELEIAELQNYKDREINSYWKREVSLEAESDSQLMESLREKLSKKDFPGAGALIKQHADSYRTIAIEHALAPSNKEAFDETCEFILNVLKDSSMDRTIAALLDPLKGPNRGKVMQGRALVKEGIRAFQQFRFRDSSQFYDLAEAAIKDSGSLFDELWIALNRTDIEIRSVNLRSASAIEDVIIRARQANFLWLLGQALTSKASNVIFTENFDGSVRMLDDAITTFASAGTPRHAARAMSYLAIVHATAGDFETGLQIACEALRITQPDDHIRLAGLYYVASLQLYRLGFERYAIQLSNLALIEARATKNPSLIATAATNLATFYVAKQEYASAEESVAETRDTLNQIEPPSGRAIGELLNNLLCGRIKIGTGDLVAAEECLARNIEILNRQPIKSMYSAQTMLQLSEVYSLEGYVERAGQKLREAVDVIEDNDVFLANNSLRMSFENERRNLYDVAITFEYDYGSQDTAWSYLQRYRSKLFLEFLRQANPSIAPIRDRAINRDKVQQLVPQDVQVVEYVMLKDRLLIWLVSREKFSSVAVPITREELEKQVGRLIEGTQHKTDVRQQAEELHRLLIEPIEAQLDPRRALAVVPDQALHRLNFSALFSAKDQSYLIERYTLLESPSLTSLLFAGTSAPRRTGAVAFGAQADDTQATAELRRLKPFYSDMRSFNGPSALKPAFLSSLTNAGIFHYAGHSQDASDPIRSSILLDGNREGPNSISAVDIAARRMPPNSVVVLASCDSSVGNSRDGLGVRGLTSAFLISGAGSVVGSLWLVEADNTSRLVLAFHKGFAQDHLSVAEALRKAQLPFIKEGIHPYYWSGFVVTGNLSALQ